MKVLIVEDELHIRKGIINTVKWHEIGFEQPLEAKNGEQALNIIRQCKPDIMMLDINLPKLNGIQLLEILKRENIYLHVIVLSGHSKFEYAREALKYGACEYLLKPVSADEIERLLVEMRKRILEEEEEKKQVEGLKNKAQENLPKLQKNYMDSLLNGDFENAEYIKSYGENIGIPLNGAYNAVFVCSVYYCSEVYNGCKNEPGNNYDKYNINFKEEISKLISAYKLRANVRCSIYTHKITKSKVLVIVNDSSINSIFVAVTCLTKEISGVLKKQANIYFNIGVGEIYEGIEYLRNSYYEACNALDYYFIYGFNIIIEGKKPIPQDSKLPLLPVDLKRQLSKSIKSCSTGAAREEISKLIDFLIESAKCQTVENIRGLCREIISVIVNTVAELGEKPEDIVQDEFAFIMDNRILFHVEQFRELLFILSDRIINYISNQKYMKYNSIIKKVNQYIIENYRNEKLDVTSIADYVKLNPNYLSHYYKAETGEFLTGFIKKYRIKKAREMMLKNSDLKLVDVALNVGFSNQHYFTICFKDVEGITPTQYKKMNEEN